MRSRLYSVISILVFAILYCYTAIGVFIVLIFAFLKMRKPITFLSQIWAKSVFLIMGKKFKVTWKGKYKERRKIYTCCQSCQPF